MERKQIFYFNEIKFVCDTVEGICKNNDIDCYTLQDIRDFSYLIDDLNPSLLVVDSKILSSELQISTFWEGVSSCRHRCKTMLVSEIESDVLQKDFDHFYFGKIDLITFGNTLKNHLK